MYNQISATILVITHGSYRSPQSPLFRASSCLIGVNIVPQGENRPLGEAGHDHNNVL